MSVWQKISVTIFVVVGWPFLFIGAVLEALLQSVIGTSTYLIDVWKDK